MQYLIILAIGILALAAACFFAYRRTDLLETDIEIALAAISRQTKTIADLKRELEAQAEARREFSAEFAEFKERFDDVMTEAEKQVEEEIKWNTGLNNILNFCLDDAFNAGGGKK